jgi:nitroreductase
MGQLTATERMIFMNETLRTIAARYSCRAYLGRLPEKEKLDAIALAAVQSPSGMNRQPWQVVVISNKAFIDEMDAEGMRILGEAQDKSGYERIMGRGGKLFYNTPCMFLILKQKGTEMDTGIVSENIALAAASLGLGSVICGMAGIPFSGPKGEAFKQRAGFSEGFEYGIAVLVGYAKTEGAPHKPDTTKIRFVE